MSSQQGKRTKSAAARRDPNALGELGEKIFLDRYALKDVTKKSLGAGDTVVVCVDLKTGQREIGEVVASSETVVTVELRDGSVVERAIEHIDKPIELHPSEMMDRVAAGIAAVEPVDSRAEWERNFRWLLDGWKFVPGGRILTAAGTDQQLTYYNCYVIPSPRDSRRGIIDGLAQMMEIMSRGGGVGINLSSLRPKHAYVKGVNGRSSGSVSWGGLFSFVTGLIEQGGSRRGALMLILNVWHPDILEFISSKQQMGKITNANISVGITDDFMKAVENDRSWDLIFPDTSDPEYNVVWDGDLAGWQARGKAIIVHKTLRAREIWTSITESAWASAEPGVWFSERANKMSNSWYYAPLCCTNPCGEQALPAYGVCNLGAINLSKFVRGGKVEWETLRKTIGFAVRFLDDVVDATPYFFEENSRQQGSERRVGLGTMGLAEMLIGLGLRYGSEESISFIDELFAFIATEAYRTSSDLASEKGSFPQFDKDKFLASGFMREMPEEIRNLVGRQGIRNVTLLTQAPTGTTGTLVGTSTGIEPFYSWTYLRKSRLGTHEEHVQVVEAWRTEHPDDPLPPHFVTAMELTPEEHVKVEAALQRWTDSSISKTANLPAEYTVDQTRGLYELMYALGCKGGTVYRDGSRDEQVLYATKSGEERASTATPPAAPAAVAEPKVRPRPYKRRGATVSRPTPIGTAHITMNDDDEGRPFEVFLEIGKAGSDIKAIAEAMGRLMSLILRVASPVPPVERVSEIINQIKGIGGARSLGFGKNRVRSLPDAVALALEEHYQMGSGERNEEHPVEGAKSNGKGRGKVSADLCPACGLATYVHEEGCMVCHSCGYSEC